MIFYKNQLFLDSAKLPIFNKYYVYSIRRRQNSNEITLQWLLPLMRCECNYQQMHYLNDYNSINISLMIDAGFDKKLYTGY